MSNAHGTVTGAAGGVLLRPFARRSPTGDSVTTYGRNLEHEMAAIAEPSARLEEWPTTR